MFVVPLEYFQKVPGGASSGRDAAKPPASWPSKSIRVTSDSGSAYTSEKRRPLRMRRRSSREMPARGSPGARHSSSRPLSSSLSVPSPTSVPISAPITLFVIDQPLSGVSDVMP